MRLRKMLSITSVLVLILIMATLALPVSAAGTDEECIDPCASVVRCGCGGSISFIRKVTGRLQEVGDYGELWVLDYSYDLYGCDSCTYTCERNRTQSDWYILN